MKSYKDLPDITTFLLEQVRKKPGMYLKKQSIENLSIFITGYMFGYYITENEKTPEDKYFGENGFVYWFHKKYNYPITSTWTHHFLDEAGQDEEKALYIYFKYLEEFNREYPTLNR